MTSHSSSQRASLVSRHWLSLGLACLFAASVLHTVSRTCEKFEVAAYRRFATPQQVRPASYTARFPARPSVYLVPEIEIQPVPEFGVRVRYQIRPMITPTPRYYTS